MKEVWFYISVIICILLFSLIAFGGMIYIGNRINDDYREYLSEHSEKTLVLQNVTITGIDENFVYISDNVHNIDRIYFGTLFNRHNELRGNVTCDIVITLYLYKGEPLNNGIYQLESILYKEGE